MVVALRLKPRFQTTVWPPALKEATFTLPKPAQPNHAFTFILSLKETYKLESGGNLYITFDFELFNLLDVLEPGLLIDTLK